MTIKHTLNSLTRPTNIMTFSIGRVLPHYILAHTLKSWIVSPASAGPQGYPDAVSAQGSQRMGRIKLGLTGTNPERVAAATSTAQEFLNPAADATGGERKN